MGTVREGGSVNVGGLERGVSEEHEKNIGYAERIRVGMDELAGCYEKVVRAWPRFPIVFEPCHGMGRAV